MGERTAAREAAFFLQHLRGGMRVLDVGCGPGAITLGLAEVVAPGSIVGLDIQASQVDQAKHRATRCGGTNLLLVAGDAYRLPFAPHSFDAAFAHAVLMHLRVPVRALEEIRRVLRPGGIAGLRDPDWGAEILAPSTPLLEECRSLRIRVRRHHGGDPFVGRDHRRLLLQAGFARAEARATVESAGSLEETRRDAAFRKAAFQGAAATAEAEGWVNRATVDSILAEIDAWAERPDAFLAKTWCEAVGWTGR